MNPDSSVRLRPIERRTRGIILWTLVIASLGLALWTIYLDWRLPKMYVSQHWRLAWVGLDSLEVVALLATTWSAYKRRVVLILFSSAAATMFVLDAWFDVTTARSGDVRQSVITAALVEIPAALALYVVSVVALRRVVKEWSTVAVTSDQSRLWRASLPYSERSYERTASDFHSHGECIDT